MVCQVLAISLPRPQVSLFNTMASERAANDEAEPDINYIEEELQVDVNPLAQDVR